MKKTSQKSEQWLKLPASGIMVSLQHFLINVLKTVSSILKILIQSKRATPICNPTPFDEVVVLGNGPSAKEFLEQKQDFLQQKAILAVNFFAKHEKFAQLKPSFYVLADPAFFLREEAAGILDILRNSVNWNLLLMIPNYAKKQALWKEKQAVLLQNTSIKIAYYNMTKIDGFDCFLYRAISKGWGLPAPRNVLVPSIAHCIRMNFKTIYVAGADHSWIKQLWINDNNEVMIDDKHFYDTSNSKQIVRVAPLCIVLESISLALKSYIHLNNLAQKKNVRILNITPGSYIDVFDRLKI